MRAEKMLRRFSIEAGWALDHRGYSELTEEDVGYLSRVVELVRKILNEIELKEQTREPLTVPFTSANKH